MAWTEYMQRGRVEISCGKHSGHAKNMWLFSIQRALSPWSLFPEIWSIQTYPDYHASAYPASPSLLWLSELLTVSKRLMLSCSADSMKQTTLVESCQIHGTFCEHMDWIRWLQLIVRLPPNRKADCSRWIAKNDFVELFGLMENPNANKSIIELIPSGCTIHPLSLETSLMYHDREWTWIRSWVSKGKYLSSTGCVKLGIFSRNPCRHSRHRWWWEWGLEANVGSATPLNLSFK